MAAMIGGWRGRALRRRGRAVLVLVLLAMTHVALIAHFVGLTSYLRSRWNSAVHDSTLLAKEPMVYDEACGHLHPPYNVSALTGSAQMSYQSGTLSAVRQALTSGNLDNKRVVLIGDSVMYQIFASLVCLARSAGGLVDEHSLSAKVIGGSQIMFDEWGGELLTYNSRKQETMEKDREIFLGRLAEKDRHGHNWLTSCEDRETMRFEGISLTGNDIVLTHATVHLAGRQANMEKIVRLLTCMEHARRNGEDPGWPTILVVASLPQHFPERGGEYSDAARVDPNGCLVSIRPEENQFYQQETLHFVQNGITLVGRDLGLEDLGMYHIGALNPEVRLDCTHWSMPGVPDLIAKEIMEMASESPSI